MSQTGSEPSTPEGHLYDGYSARETEGETILYITLQPTDSVLPIWNSSNEKRALDEFYHFSQLLGGIPNLLETMHSQWLHPQMTVQAFGQKYCIT